MFPFFINFIENTIGIKIENNNDNRKEFISKIDKDKSNSIELDEINSFFDNYVSLENKTVTL